MSKYSEIIGSFVRMGNFPIEADYIFANEADLKAYYEQNKAILHLGLLKTVQDDGTGQQALYWVVDNKGELEFTKLVTGNIVESIKPQLEEILTKLNNEIEDRKYTDEALWGTANPTIIPDNLNSIFNLSEAINDINDKFRQFTNGVFSGLVKDAYYDPNTECLIILFNLENGTTQKISIPFTNLIREWTVNNSHPSKVVELTREEIYGGGEDKLSADVRLSTNPDNILIKDGNTLLVEGISSNIDHNGVALNIIINRLQKRIKALEEALEENTQAPISIMSFTADCELIAEIGSVLNPTFTWSYNLNKIDNQTLNGIAVDIASRSKQLTNITTNTKVTLFVSYKGYTDTKELQIVFMPKVYFGSSELEDITDASQLANNNLGANLTKASFDCTGGKYAYYMIPSSYKDKVKFYVENFEVDAYSTKPLFVDNVEYTLFKLDNKYYGQFYMDVKIE